MKLYRVSRAGQIQTIILLLTLGFTALYAGRKAYGLWMGITGKPSDVFLFNLNLNTSVPAALLTLLSVSALLVGWYLLIEILTRVRLSDGGLLVTAPGFRVFYRWNEISSMDIISGPAEDATVSLLVKTRPESQQGEKGSADSQAISADKIEPFLSEVDLLKDRQTRSRNKAARRLDRARIRAIATRPDGRVLPLWVRMLYPQTLHPDRILLFPSLENRNLILAEIESHLSNF